MRYFALFIGLAAGNFFSAGMFDVPISTATERSFFQAIALLVAGLSDAIARRGGVK